MDPEKNKLDRWLDQALSDYGKVEPRLGLETRILANLATEKTCVTKRILWPRAFASVTVTLSVIVAVWWWVNTRQAHTPTNFANNNTTIQKELPVSTKPEAQAPVSVITKRAVRRQRVKAAELAESPRLNQFPSVRELGTQEQLLARYAREFPQQALEISQAQAKAEQERISGEMAAE